MELGFQHLASHRCSFTLFKFPVLQIVFSQLTTEDFLTADELGWFPGSLVLGQVLGILLGPLLADLVNSLKWPSANNPKLVCILYIKCVYYVDVGGQKNHLPACGSHLLCLLAPSLNQVLLLTLLLLLLLLLQLLLLFLVSLSPGFMGLLLLLLLFFVISWFHWSPAPVFDLNESFQSCFYRVLHQSTWVDPPSCQNSHWSHRQPGDFMAVAIMVVM